MAGGMDEAELRRFAIRTRGNEETTLAFILALIALGLVFISFHLVRQSVYWIRRGNGQSKMPSFLIAIPRHIRKAGLRHVAGVPSLGHASILTIFFVFNVVALFVNMNNENMTMISNISSRSGWLAMANLLFVTLFALKNTPLAFLTACSYERLNCLHRASGYAAVAHVLVHAICYSVNFAKLGLTMVLLQPSDIMGMVAGASWILMALSAIFIRRRWYELFYYLHITLWIVSLVSLGLHRPDLTVKVAIGTVVAGSMWGLDRLIRLLRLMLHTVNNSATLTPLPDGGTRVTLAKPPMNAMPGKHAFLWIPKIRLFQTHPFTIASADPVEFVIASRDGFTGALHSYALANPNACVKASVEGPYGTVPEPSAFEIVLLIAGGSGASFTFGLAQTLLGRVANNITRKVVFVWVVKQDSYLEWFANHLAVLGKDVRFSTRVFVTRSGPPSRPSGSESDNGVDKDFEKEMMRDAEMDKFQIQETHRPGSDSSIDLEKSQTFSGGVSTWTRDTNHGGLNDVEIQYRRPDVAELVREAVGDAAQHERVLIAGCGPDKLMDLLRKTTADCIRSDGPSIELHCEKFGW